MSCLGAKEAPMRPGPEAGRGAAGRPRSLAKRPHPFSPLCLRKHVIRIDRKSFNAGPVLGGDYTLRPRESLGLQPACCEGRTRWAAAADRDKIAGGQRRDRPWGR